MNQNVNAKSFPESYYGIHFSEGLAEYREEAGIARILIKEETIKNMNPSLINKPVYVHHVDEVNLENLQNEADGYVTDSFWNPADGKCWCKFIVISDRGKEAIQRGWKLSNAYRPLTRTGGGQWHGVDYSEEITSAEYEHLAIVPDPRYEESIILTSDQFKQYNEEKQMELKKLANSKDKPLKGETNMGGFKFFKKAKIENALDVENTIVELPQSKKEVSIADLILKMDKIENMAGYASPDHMVKVGEEEMTVKDACNELMKHREEAMKKDAKSEDGGEPGSDDEAMNSEASVDEDMKDVDSRGGDESLKNEEEEEMKKKEEFKKNEIKKKVTALKNAGPRYQSEPEKVLLASDKVALGKARYGSSN